MLFYNYFFSKILRVLERSGQALLCIRLSMVVVAVNNSDHNVAVHLDRNDSRIRIQKQKHHVAAGDVDSLYIIFSYKIII